MIYLETRYPQIYDNKLTQGVDPSNAENKGDIERMRDGLHTTIQANGGLQGAVWNAKIDYFTSEAPGTTVFAAQTGAGPPPVVGPPAPSDYQRMLGAVTFNQFPTFQFLYNQIKDGEDVEFGLFNHMVTLIGMKIDKQGKMQAEVIDPNNPNTPGGGGDNATPSDQWINLTLNNGVLYVPKDFYPIPPNPGGMATASPIYYAFAESPVPEPSVLVGICGLGVMGLVFWSRRQKVLSAS
jgi:hypothetical protein